MGLAMKVLRGAPRKSETWSLESRPFHISLLDDGLHVEFRVRLPKENGEFDFSGAESLASIAMNSPDDLRFGVSVEEDGGDGLYLFMADTKVCRIGSIPSGIRWAMNGWWGKLLDLGVVESSKFDVYMAPVREAVSYGAVFDVADLIESDDSIDVDSLISEMTRGFAEIIYHVKVGLFVSRDRSASPKMLSGIVG